MRKKSKLNKHYSATPPASGRTPVRKLVPRDVLTSAEELVAFHRLFARLFQRREQRFWSFFYLCGQLANLERKTIEPMALALHGADPNAIRALQHFIGQGRWDTLAVVIQGQQLVADWLGDPEGVLIVDGSGFPKQGHDSVGVARQYCGHLGKVANCQEGAFLVYASQHGHAFLDERLYVPESWFEAEAHERWLTCGIPDDTVFRTEPGLALDMIGGLVARAVVPFRWVTADEPFGQNPAFLQGISALGKWYLVEVPADTRFWSRRPQVEPPGRGLLGRPRLSPRVVKTAPPPQAVRDVAARLPPSAWTRHLIKEGGKGPRRADFAFRRMVTVQDKLPGSRVWVILRRSVTDPREVKYYISNAPTTCAPTDFVQVSGMRWPIETALEEGKGEVGMDHYETRTWSGWHHHMAQTFLAHLFLMRLRLVFKKKPRPYDGPGPTVSGPGHRRRLPAFARCYSCHPLSPGKKPCSLLLASQTHACTISSKNAKVEITRNLVVM